MKTMFKAAAALLVLATLVHAKEELVRRRNLDTGEGHDALAWRSDYASEKGSFLRDADWGEPEYGYSKGSKSYSPSDYSPSGYSKGGKSGYSPSDYSPSDATKGSKSYSPSDYSPSYSEGSKGGKGEF